MAAIMEGTRFDYYNALEERAYKVRQIFKMSQHPTTIFVALEGENPGWRVGQTISFRNSTTAFTGSIWYIHKGQRADGTKYYNLYVKPPNYSSISPAKGGEVIAGTFPVKSILKPIAVAPTAAASQLDPFAAPGPAATPGPVAAPATSGLPAFVNIKNAAIALVVVIAGAFIMKKKNK